jgi:hypothetical protein
LEHDACRGVVGRLAKDGLGDISTRLGAIPGADSHSTSAHPSTHESGRSTSLTSPRNLLWSSLFLPAWRLLSRFHLEGYMSRNPYLQSTNIRIATIDREKGFHIVDENDSLLSS